MEGASHGKNWVSRKRRMESDLMKSRQSSDSHSDSEKRDRWLITFSDLCTLLLTFFVLLLSMSSLNQRSFKMVFQNFNASSGVLRYSDREKVSLQPDMVTEELMKSLQSVYTMDIRDVDEITEEQVHTDESLNFLVSSGNAIWMKKDETDAFSFIFGERMLFETASAELNPAAHPVLDKIGEFLNSTDYVAFVDGHTDSIPISNEMFPSNRELSVARAYSVLNHLIERNNVPSGRLAMGGYGSSHPLADNATPTGREMNRRVEIIMKKPR